MRKLIIDGKTIQDFGQAYVIAEIGHNHQGDIAAAKKLFKVARECGADCFKKFSSSISWQGYCP
ncbi:MAG: hypothetical protein GY850_27775 [bacterium]|nr:hypothetical protein [bacterium]